MDLSTMRKELEEWGVTGADSLSKKEVKAVHAGMAAAREKQKREEEAEEERRAAAEAAALAAAADVVDGSASSSSVHESRLLQLPDDIFSVVFEFLSIPGLVTLGNTSALCRFIVNMCAPWEQLEQRYYISARLTVAHEKRTVVPKGPLMRAEIVVIPRSSVAASHPHAAPRLTWEGNRLAYCSSSVQSSTAPFYSLMVAAEKGLIRDAYSKLARSLTLYSNYSNCNDKDPEAARKWAKDVSLNASTWESKRARAELVECVNRIIDCRSRIKVAKANLILADAHNSGIAMSVNDEESPVCNEVQGEVDEATLHGLWAAVEANRAAGMTCVALERAEVFPYSCCPDDFWTKRGATGPWPLSTWRMESLDSDREAEVDVVELNSITHFKGRDFHAAAQVDAVDAEKRKSTLAKRTTWVMRLADEGKLVHHRGARNWLLPSQIKAEARLRR